MLILISTGVRLGVGRRLIWANQGPDIKSSSPDTATNVPSMISANGNNGSWSLLSGRHVYSQQRHCKKRDFFLTFPILAMALPYYDYIQCILKSHFWEIWWGIFNCLTFSNPLKTAWSALKIKACINLLKTFNLSGFYQLQYAGTSFAYHISPILMNTILILLIITVIIIISAQSKWYPWACWGLCTWDQILLCKPSQILPRLSR